MSWKLRPRALTGLSWGLQHRTHPIYGVQFHPESILTAAGPALLRNFLMLAEVPVAA